jgi:rhodanese-related sulfurtransferase
MPFLFFRFILIIIRMYVTGDGPVNGPDHSRTRMRNKRAIKNALFDQVARVSKAMASPKRLELVSLLSQGPKAVEDLAAETDMSIKLASAHLKDLRLACLVETERHGKRIVYRLANAAVADLWVALREVAEDRLAELQAVVTSLGRRQDEWRSQDRGELLQKVRNGEVVLLDVRPADEFEYGHLPNARSMPHNELKARLGELPTDRPIVAYCRGPYCLFAADAVALLRGKGFEASHLREGTAEWAFA